MLITDTFLWDHPTFEAYIEGMCAHITAFPHERVAFVATTSPETILTLFATWKMGKIACPLSPRLPTLAPVLTELETALFTPSMPQPLSPIPWNYNLSQLAAFLYTSGSTAKPKIACLSLGNLLHSAQGSNQFIPLDPSDQWALTLPLFHVGGLGILWRCYLAQCSILLSDNWTSATHLSLVPTQLFRLLKNQPSLPRLKTILLGGAPLPNIETPWNILPSYGMTEMSSQIVTGHQIHPHAEVHIAQNQEIWVRGAVLFQGYYTHELGITLPLNEEGWFATQDLGRWTDGRFQILGRQDNLFISGGENIQPEEIEEALRKHCHCEEAWVVPMSDEEFGKRPVAFLKPHLSVSEVQQRLQAHLPKFKIPVRTFPVPPSEGLKVSRKALLKLGNVTHSL
jgi:o-succinylbenzoate---CoA ligase